MFRKPFKVKSNNAIRGSERRKLKDHLRKSYPRLPSDDIALIVPNKDPMSVVNILTHNDTSVTCYCLNKTPVLFNANDVLLPTVYTLWKYPHMCLSFKTFPHVLSILAGGADLMFPGVIPSASGFPDFESKTSCYVKLQGNGRAAVAVGVTSCSSQDLRHHGCVGKRVTIYHCFKDQLWAFGEKESPPSIPDVDDGELLDQYSDGENNDTPYIKQISEDVNELQISSETESGEQVVSTNDILSVDGNRCEENGTKEQVETTAAVESAEEVPELTPHERMDLLIENCFYQALLDAKKIELPILVSKFSSLYLHTACPEGERIDVKKSSYKKMSKLLAEMQNHGLVEVREFSKGVESITKINVINEKIKTYSISEFAHKRKVFNQEKSVEEKEMKKQQSKTVEVRELFAVSAKVGPFFKLYQKGKGSVFSSSEIRQLITRYVKDNELTSSNNKKEINLDALLSDVLFNKGKHQHSLTWDGIMTSMLQHMNPCHEVKYPGEEAVVRKGKMDFVEVTTEKRMGNKMVTIVKNLESFGIDMKVFAQGLQQAAASSTSVNPVPGKNGGHLVIVQGLQMKHVKTLIETHKIPLKFVKGLDLKQINK